MPRAAAYQRIFHDQDIVTDPDFGVLGGQYRAVQHSRPLAESDRAVQHSRPLAESDRAAQHSRGCDVGGLRNNWPFSTMSEDHAGADKVGSPNASPVDGRRCTGAMTGT